jgi:pyrroline-5-carboxylate reductase
MTTPLAALRIGFVGGGNIAEALVRGLLGGDGDRPRAIEVADVDAGRRDHLASRYGVATTADNAALGRGADVVVFAVKPQQTDEALAALAQGFRPEALLVSVAAGVRTATLEAGLGGAARVVRAMPNTAATVRAAATALAGGRLAGDDDVATARAIFERVGRVVLVDEAALDAVTGLSGSGPAYVMLFIEALTEGGVAAGLARDTALSLAAQTVLGAAKLLLETGEDPATLRARVTSPGGTTVAGLGRLEAAGVRAAVAAAVEAATRRATELGRG